MTEKKLVVPRPPVCLRPIEARPSVEDEKPRCGAFLLLSFCPSFTELLRLANTIWPLLATQVCITSGLPITAIVVVGRKRDPDRPLLKHEQTPELRGSMPAEAESLPPESVCG